MELSGRILAYLLLRLPQQPLRDLDKVDLLGLNALLHLPQDRLHEGLGKWKG